MKLLEINYAIERYNALAKQAQATLDIATAQIAALRTMTAEDAPTGAFFEDQFMPTDHLLPF